MVGECLGQLKLFTTVQAGQSGSDFVGAGENGWRIAITHRWRERHEHRSKSPAYDRQLLGGAKDAVLDLTEVQRYGMDSYGDPDYVCIYGPAACRIGTAEGYGFWGEPRWNVPATNWPTTSVKISSPLPSPLRSHRGHG